jgi:hypothetical protein
MKKKENTISARLRLTVPWPSIARCSAAGRVVTTRATGDWTGSAIIHVGYEPLYS